MDNTNLIASGEVIEQSCSAEQASAFESGVERLGTADLVAINDYLNAGVDPEADWHDYWKAFATYEWKDFTYAYHHVTGRDFSLD